MKKLKLIFLNITFVNCFLIFGQTQIDSCVYKIYVGEHDTHSSIKVSDQLKSLIHTPLASGDIGIEYLRKETLGIDTFYYEDSYRFRYDKYMSDCIHDSNMKLNYALFGNMIDTLKIKDKSKIQFVSIISWSDSIFGNNIINYLKEFINLKYVKLMCYPNYTFPKNIGILKQIQGIDINFYPYEYDSIRIEDTVLKNIFFYHFNNKESFSNVLFDFKPEGSLLELSNLKYFSIATWTNFAIDSNFFLKLNRLKFLYVRAHEFKYDETVFNNATLENLIVLKIYPWFSKNYDLNLASKPNSKKGVALKKYSINKLPDYLFNQKETIEKYEYNNILLEKNDMRIAQLKNLRQLNGLMFLNLNHLPTSIDSLTRLNELLIYTNKKKFVRKGQLQNLSKLKTIYFEGRKYNKNVGVINSLENLYVFHCDGNLKDLKFLSNSVKHLYLYNINLKSAFKAIQNHHFNTLNVYHNDLIKIELEDLLLLNTDTLVIMKDRFEQVPDYITYQNKSFTIPIRYSLNNWDDAIKNKSKIKVIEIKKWH